MFSNATRLICECMFVEKKHQTERKVLIVFVIRKYDLINSSPQISDMWLLNWDLNDKLEQIM